ncbi:MAG: 23S rRNA (uridine(2552)-2'-O)-methyltransferase RlmE [Xanthomonadaceae bacterium]|nr:23S rRNA (uridine(2552)-2'-O)-methyltransferase RlmE [Xanthomonadaceae bacterium]
MSKPRSKSSTQWLAEHEADPYVQLARKEGYRSRAVYKLKEIQERDKVLKAGMTVVDLGAAPGGWSQYARPQIGKNGRLVALDILPMKEVPGVEFICGDFREDAVLQALEALVPVGSADLVLSDMAPNISGIDVADQASSIYLCELALDFAVQRLRPGGAFLVKLFQGEGSEAFLKMVRNRFKTVQIRKPKASRQRSPEVYVLARDHRVV